MGAPHQRKRFMVTTNDGKGEVFFDPDDYSRMARLGANFQVIRLYRKIIDAKDKDNPEINN